MRKKQPRNLDKAKHDTHQQQLNIITTRDMQHHSNHATPTTHTSSTISKQALPGIRARQPNSISATALSINERTKLAAQQAINDITALGAIKNVTPVEHANAVVGTLTDDLVELPHLILRPNCVKWIWSTANEFRRLVDGILPYMPTVLNTMR
jgi:hypothetical protein